MARKYLDDLNVKPIIVDEDEKKDNPKRYEKFLKERDIYGFDSSETWSLDYTMLTILYERLKMYLEVAPEVIAIDYHTVEYNGETVKVSELYNKMITLAEDAILCETSEYSDDYTYPEGWNDQNSSEKREENIDEFWKIWAIVHPYTWW